MAKAKRTTQASDRPTLASLSAEIEKLKEAKRFLMAAQDATSIQGDMIEGLEKRINNLESGLTDRLHNVAGSRLQNLENYIADVEKKYELVRETLEKFGGEKGLVAQAISEVKDIEAVIEAKLKGSWKSWIVPFLAIICLCGFLAVQRGCNHGGPPTPAPDENDHSIIEDAAAAKKLFGTVLFLHDRDPMTPADADILAQAGKLADDSDGKFKFRSIDFQDDPEAPDLLKLAKAKGIDPPCMMHKSESGKITYAPMAKNWAGVFKTFGK
jgi:hypothetical protein